MARRSLLLHILIVSSCMALTMHPAPAPASDETEPSHDAFGSRIGVESLGLYSESQVRGFNLQEAGNYRLDGTYFVRAAAPSDVILRSLQIRVGPSALDLDFPAPSGVVAYRLRPAHQDMTNVEMGLQHMLDSNPRPYVRAFATRRSEDGRFSVTGGWIAADSARYIYGNEARYNGVGVIPRIRFGERWRLTAFASRYDQRFQADAGFIPANGHSLPELDRLRYVGQEWSRFQTRNENHGAILTTTDAENAWDFSASSLLSQVDRPRSDFNIFRNVHSDGAASGSVVIAWDRNVQSWAHELVARRDWTTPSRRTELTLMMRRRESDYLDPITRSVDLGRVSLIDEPLAVSPLARPDGDARSSSAIDQYEAGVGLRYAARGGLSVNAGARRVSVNEMSRPADGAIAGRSSSKWLYNASIVLPLGRSLAAFAATTRGIEEAGTSPQNAANRYEVLAPVIAEQSEVGLHWRGAAGLSAIATVFEIEKPEPGFDANNVYRYLTTVQHRGVEASLAGQLSESVAVIVGGMWMEPELRGQLVESGAVGHRPVGRSSRLGWLSFERQLSFLPGLSIDADAVYNGPRFASTDNRIRTAGYVAMNAGARYRFQLADTPATLRLRIYNVLNEYGWYAAASGIHSYEPERRVMLSVTMGNTGS
ncbi:MAG: TonB-dependent siderophore receptor [Steroidobacter sp.]